MAKPAKLSDSPTAMCICDPTHGQSCPQCDGTLAELTYLEPVDATDLEDAA